MNTLAKETLEIAWLKKNELHIKWIYVKYDIFESIKINIKISFHELVVYTLSS